MPEMSDDRPGVQETPPVAAFFDLDKTVIAKSSVLAFSRQFFTEGLLDTRTLLRSAVTQLSFARSAADADHVERLRRHITTMCQGWDVSEVNRIVAETLDDVVRPLVYSGAVDLIDAHRQKGHAVALVSASGQEMVEPIGVMLGVDHVRASRMHITDGHYTGDLDFYCYGEQKAAAILQIAQEHGYDLDLCYAYSDSVTDLPMLEVVGRPTVVNPDKHLRRHAEDNGWPILDFDREPDPSFATAPALAAAVALGIGAAVGCGVGIRLTRPRRTATASVGLHL